MPAVGNPRESRYTWSTLPSCLAMKSCSVARFTSDTLAAAPSWWPLDCESSATCVRLPGVAAGAACAVELCDPLCAWVLSKLIASTPRRLLRRARHHLPRRPPKNSARAMTWVLSADGMVHTAVITRREPVSYTH